jgi:hypothetical protein
VDVLTTLASTVGLGLLAGIRLYATVFAVGLLLRFHWIELPAALQHASVLADTRVLILSGAACAIEFVADKIPWLDSAWDSLHTFIRPIGAALAATSLFSNLDPAWQVSLFLLAGGIAFTGHSAKSATRLFVNHSPEPFTNVALSFGEDLAVAGGLYLWAKHPLVLATAAVLLLAAFVWVAPRAFRALRAEWTAFRSLVRHWFGKPVAPTLKPGQHGVAFAVISDMKGLRNAIGTLCLNGRDAVFFTRKWGRAVERDLGPVAALDVKRRLLLDSLVLTTPTGDHARFDLLAGQLDRARAAADGYGRSVQ